MKIDITQDYVETVVLPMTLILATCFMLAFTSFMAVVQ